MQLSDKGAMALICREGFSRVWYLDTKNVWTIGVGHTAMAGPPAFGAGGHLLSGREVFALFRKDVLSYAAAVQRAVNVPMAQHEFDAFVSICYNIGTGAFAKSTFVKRFNAGDKAGCAKAIMAWTQDKELVSRRTAERDQFLHGLPLSHRFVATEFGITRTGQPRAIGKIDLVRDMHIGTVHEEEPPKPPLVAERPQLTAAQQAVIDDAAAEGRVSKMDVSAGAIAMTATTAAVTDAVTSVKQTVNSLIGMEPLPLAMIVIGGLALYVWYLRREKKLAARAVNNG